MDKKIELLKTEIKKASSSEKFVHHKWFVRFHLDIVEQISLELCDIYTEANRDLVQILVWTHDYGKIIDFENQHETSLIKVPRLLNSLNFDKETTETIVSFIQILDAKENLKNAPIEVQIVSSADAASHLVGPFYSLYWYEHPEKPIEDILKENARKSRVDWDKKVTLPEVKKAFFQRQKFIQEQSGMLPSRYLD